jgi:hypothetical protein
VLTRPLIGYESSFHVSGWVESAWGAVPALLLVRFPRPPAEPAVRLSPQRALHEDDAVQVVAVR